MEYEGNQEIRQIREIREIREIDLENEEIKRKTYKLSLSSLRIFNLITEYFDDILLCVFLYFLNPVFDSFETLPVCDIINHHDSMCPFVVTASYCFETVLTSSVPLINLVIQGNFQENRKIQRIYFHGVFALKFLKIRLEKL